MKQPHYLNYFLKMRLYVTKFYVPKGMMMSTFQTKTVWLKRAMFLSMVRFAREACRTRTPYIAETGLALV